MDAFLLLLVAVLALGTGLAFGLLIGRRHGDPVDAEQTARAAARAVDPVKQSLDKFEERMRELEHSRIEWHSQLREQVEAVRLTNDSLRKETASLATALRKPQVRGRWGEMHLKRTAELAGMLDHCDFDLQVTTSGDTVLRPDMVVRLAGGKSVVVDSKVPLDAYLDLVTSDSDSAEHLTRHVRQVRTHIDQLSGKAYWDRLDSSPEFVVLFVPGEAILSAALEAEPALLEYAASKHVVLATPTTLIALLRTVAYAWTQEQLAQNARQIWTEARELYDRIGTVTEHVDRLGRSLESSVKAYNDAVGSIESRFLVSARRMAALQVADQPVDSPRIIETTPRQVTAPELLDGLRS